MGHKAAFIAGKKALLNEGTRARIDHWVAKYPPENRRSALIQAMREAQDQNGGWVSKDMIEAVADYLELPPVWAFEIASFYTMIEQQPVGRHKVNICTNISCWLNGSEDLVSHVENKLGVNLGETTADNRITLVREEECLAACCGAPMMLVDGHYYENLDNDKIDKILDGLD